MSQWVGERGAGRAGGRGAGGQAGHGGQSGKGGQGGSRGDRQSRMGSSVFFLFAGVLFFFFL